jgi:hypothetical protein
LSQQVPKCRYLKIPSQITREECEEVKEKKNLTHDRTTAKALKQQKGNKGGKDPGTARHERILLQPIHSRTRFNPSESKCAPTPSPPPPPPPVMVVLVEDLDLFSFFHNKTHIESHVQVH